jgi:predicted nucleotide-binding protein (sugar kinase/HSP70/actin superfamily)
MKYTERKVAFPRYAEYNAALKYLLENGLGVSCIVPPPLSDRTLKLGAKYSPDFVCTPFKITLGSMIEALESGANTLLMAYGICKLGYYGELQEQILRDLGYDFDFINLEVYNTGKKKAFIDMAKAVNPRVNMPKCTAVFFEALNMGAHLDEITAEYYQNCGFAADRHAYQAIYKNFISEMYSANSALQIGHAYREARRAMLEQKIEKPANPLRVGITGDFYTAVDAFSNANVEQRLADMGVEVHRWINVTNRMLRYPGEKNLNIKIKDYCRYEMGPNSTANIWATKDYAERGFDGVLHVKAAACTPEIDIMPVLQNISRDYKMPVLYLTYDSQTSDVGLVTRLEAFYDMIAMRKKVFR